MKKIITKKKQNTKINAKLEKERKTKESINNLLFLHTELVKENKFSELIKSENIGLIKEAKIFIKNVKER